MGLLSVTIDLDEIRCYHAIHGIEEQLFGDAVNVIYRRTLPRIGQFLEELELKGTLFAVGNDLLEVGEAASILRDLVGRGQEVGNHTMSHRYDLTLLSRDDQAAEIDRATEVIKQTIGVSPVGFRAPGYNVHLGLTDLLRDRGYHYDSSIFPCPAYYSARAAAIGIKAIKGRRSASFVGDPRMLGASTSPYRIGEDGVWTHGDGLCELPITVVTPARLPFIGTSLALMGSLSASLLARVAARLKFVNLELHGIDFTDADGDGLGHLKEFQPEMRIPLVKRRKTFRRVIKVLLDAGLEPVTLKEAALRLFV